MVLNRPRTRLFCYLQQCREQFTYLPFHHSPLTLQSSFAAKENIMQCSSSSELLSSLFPETAVCDLLVVHAFLQQEEKTHLLQVSFKASPGYRQVLPQRSQLGVQNVSIRDLNTARKDLTHFTQPLSGISTVVYHFAFWYKFFCSLCSSLEKE